MMYQSSDAYGRSRYNPVAMRAVVIDKLRERLLGLMFVPDEARPTLSRLTTFFRAREGKALRRLSPELGRQS